MYNCSLSVNLRLGVNRLENGLINLILVSNSFILNTFHYLIWYGPYHASNLDHNLSCFVTYSVKQTCPSTYCLCNTCLQIRCYNAGDTSTPITVEPLVKDHPISEKKWLYNGGGLIPEVIFLYEKHLLFYKTWSDNGGGLIPEVPMFIVE